VATNSALTFADGMAVRVPDATALEVVRKGAERIIEVTDDEIAEAIRSIYSATHNCAAAVTVFVLIGIATWIHVGTPTPSSAVAGPTDSAPTMMMGAKGPPTSLYDDYEIVVH
jgi:threonine synthase